MFIRMSSIYRYIEMMFTMEFRGKKSNQSGCDGLDSYFRIYASNADGHNGLRPVVGHRG